MATGQGVRLVSRLWLPTRSVGVETVTCGWLCVQNKKPTGRLPSGARVLQAALKKLIFVLTICRLSSYNLMMKPITTLPRSASGGFTLSKFPFAGVVNLFGRPLLRPGILSPVMS